MNPRGRVDRDLAKERVKWARESDRYALNCLRRGDIIGAAESREAATLWRTVAQGYLRSARLAERVSVPSSFAAAE